MNDIDVKLSEAGRRLRADAPTDGDARVALTEMQDGATASSVRSLRRWPIYLTVGAAALVGILASTVRQDDAIRTVPAAPAPESTEVVGNIDPERDVDPNLGASDPPIETTPVETTSPYEEGLHFISDATATPDGCFEATISLAVSGAEVGDVAGCLPAGTIDGTMLRTRLGNTTLRLAFWEDDMSTWRVYETGDDTIFDCGSNAALAARPEGAMFEMLVCSDLEPEQSASLLRSTGTARDDPAAGATFTTSLRIGAEATLEPVDVDGLPDGTLTFLDRSNQCLELVDSLRSQWRSVCALGSERGAIITFGVSAFQIDRTGGSFVATELTDVVAPLTNGCAAVDGRAIVNRLLTDFPTSAVTAIRCVGSPGLDVSDDAQASAVLAPVLHQVGPPDGMQVSLDRLGGSWEVTDFGIAVGDFTPNPIPTFETWSDLSTGAVPRLWTTGLSWSGNPTSLDEWADVLLDGLESAVGTDTSEFPTTFDVVAVAPDDLPLIVFESTVGGDDSSNGAYLYVWFNNGRSPEARGDEQNFTGVFVSDRCIRGVSDGLCI